MKKQKLVVVGNGMAGMRTIEELLTAAPDMYEISVFGAEPHGNYNRILLSSVLSGEKNLHDIVIHDREWYQRHHIQLHTGPGKAVVEIKRGLGHVVTADGSVAEFDRLLVATGSKPIMPDLPGSDLNGVIAFRDIEHVDTMLRYSQTHRHAIVLGGGLLGLEAANGLLQRGMSVTVIHNHAVLMNRQLDSEAGQLLQNQLRAKGMAFELAVRLQEIIGNSEQHIEAVQLDDGRVLACDLLVCAIGVQPNIQLAKQAGLYCERGIVVNDTLQSYDPSIYAVGECIQHRGQTFGLVAPLYEQAKICANHLAAHGIAEYVTPPMATQLKVTGIQLFSVGDFMGDESSETLQFSDNSLGIYKKVVLKNQKIQGAVLYGDTQDGRWYQDLIEQGYDITDLREQLLFGQQAATVSAVTH